MIKVQFNFDPETNKVSELTVTGAELVTKETKPKTTKPKKKKDVVETDNIVYNGSSLQLNTEALGFLGLVVGDRVCVRFNADNQPVLLSPNVAREPNGGNLITKGLTVPAKGKIGEHLGAPGEFSYHLKQEGYLILTRESTTEIDEEKVVTKAKATIAKVKEQPIIGDIQENEYLSDADFTEGLDEGVEVDFELDIQ